MCIVRKLTFLFASDKNTAAHQRTGHRDPSQHPPKQHEYITSSMLNNFQPIHTAPPTLGMYGSPP
jgi:hypothetical protein